MKTIQQLLETNRAELLQKFRAMWIRSYVKLGVPPRDQIISPEVDLFAFEIFEKYQGFTWNQFHRTWNEHLPDLAQNYGVFNFGLLCKIIHDNIRNTTNPNQIQIEGDGLTPELRKLKEFWDRPIEEITADKMPEMLADANDPSRHYKLIGQHLDPVFKFIGSQINKEEKENLQIKVSHQWKNRVISLFGVSDKFFDGLTPPEVVKKISKIRQFYGVPIPSFNHMYRIELVKFYDKMKVI